MFALAFALGIFSYIIFLLGMIGLLYKPLVSVITLLFWIAFIFLYQERIINFFKEKRTYSLLFVAIITLLVLQALVNSVGLFGPEIGFDALWYHLTLPKMYLQYHSVIHIPGGVLYYSDMPKLTEMLYAAALSFSSEVFAKGVHFFLGILCCVALYKVARKFFSPSFSILAPLIFYSNLVVGWESVSAYIDLSRTFFEILALWSFLNWTETKKQEWFVKAALLVGLAISTKLLAAGSLVIYIGAILWFEHSTLCLVARLKRIGIFSGLALLVPLPWFVFSFIHTGNPLYPLFSQAMPKTIFLQIINPLYLTTSVWRTFAAGADPIHPIYLLSIPFLIMYWKKLYQAIPLLLIMTLYALAVWYLIPFDGGGRYILAYVPLFTIVILYAMRIFSNNWRKGFVVIILFCSVISIGYRALANEKFIPVITGKQTRSDFLTHHLDFSLGDFYDTDGYFASHIKSTDKVLLYGFHNLYYVNFPYVHSSWAEKGDRFNYVAVQGNGTPERFKYWNLIYFNNTNQVRLYADPNSLWRSY